MQSKIQLFVALTMAKLLQVGLLSIMLAAVGKRREFLTRAEIWSILLL
jgi:hypothetical protein